jgi:type IV secretory pathway ATPase VirB11/archaellum biosynthesis ATPase
MDLLDRFRGSERGSDCDCRPRFEDGRLVVDADGCAGGGDLAAAPACRAAVVDALADRDADAVVTRAAGVERAYEGNAAALLIAAGRFVDRAAFHDEALADRARREPLRAGRQAAGRAGPVATAAAETGLAEGAARADDYDDALRPFVGPTVARSRVATRPPTDARLVERRELSTGAVARLYARPGDELRTYHLLPPELDLSPDALTTLETARGHLARGGIEGGERAPGRAVRAVADADEPVAVLADALGKHTRGDGVLEDFFADPDCSDVFVTAPAGDRPLRARVSGETVRTNVRLTDRAVETLASRYRRESGRAFSRASPTLDATTAAAGRRIRVAGVTEPVTDGVAFAFRAHERTAWTLPALIDNGTLPTAAGSVLSLAAERGAAVLVAGGRGAGKTTLLGALCWELPAAVRTVAIEDTPELPVDRLRAAGRDVQRLRAASDADAAGVAPTESLRTALRLGEGALVVGEVRGEEASALFEAMRVGATEGAVLGTIHGEKAAGVRRRLAELGVPAPAFAATDLLVTCESGPDGRRVAAVEEVRAVEASGSNLESDDAEVAVTPLFNREGTELAATGRIARGDSHLVDALTRPDETYADVRRALADRERWLAERVTGGDTDADAVVEAHARRRDGR